MNTSVLEVNIAVVIPTLRSPETLRRLLESIRLQQLQPVEVIVVAQGNDEAARDMVESSGVKNSRVIHSDPGLSKARNAGISALSTDWDLVATPDDDVWYRSDSFYQAATSFLDGYAAISGMVVPENPADGLRLRFSDMQRVLDARSVWTSAIEAGFFLSSSLVDEVGGFDEELGLGSATPWQSGEGTDLLLRSLAKGYRVGYNPLIHITEATSAQSLPASTKRARDYARGTGRVYRRQYGVPARAMLVLRSVGRIALELKRGGLFESKKATAVLIGRVEGLIGWVHADA